MPLPQKQGSPLEQHRFVAWKEAGQGCRYVKETQKDSGGRHSACLLLSRADRAKDHALALAKG